LRYTTDLVIASRQPGIRTAPMPLFQWDVGAGEFWLPTNTFPLTPKPINANLATLRSAILALIGLGVSGNVIDRESLVAFVR